MKGSEAIKFFEENPDMDLMICIDGEDYYDITSIGIEARQDDEGVSTNVIVLLGEDDDGEGEGDEQEDDAATGAATAENGVPETPEA